MFKNKFWLLVGAGLVATSAALGGAGPGIRGVNYDLLCVAIEGVENNKSALAVLRVQKDGQAQGALCYLDTLQVADLEDCHLVAGRALTAPRASLASFVGLVGTGIDTTGPDLLELIQNDVAVRFQPALETGQGAATEFIVKPTSPTAKLNVTGVGKAYQGACRYDLETKRIFVTPQFQSQLMRAASFSILSIHSNYIIANPRDLAGNIGAATAGASRRH